MLSFCMACFASPWRASRFEHRRTLLITVVSSMDIRKEHVAMATWNLLSTSENIQSLGLEESHLHGTSLSPLVYRKSSISNVAPCWLLLGWLGASYRYVEKIGEYIGERYDHHVLVHVAPFQVVMADKLGDQQGYTMQLLLALFAEPWIHESVESCGMIIMAFSNGGAFIATRIYDICKGQMEISAAAPVLGNENVDHIWAWWSHNICGIVFDSAPARMTTSSRTGAVFYSSSWTRSRFALLVYCSIFAKLYINDVLLRIRNLFTNHGPLLHAYFHEAMKHQFVLGRAELYIFSDSDPICDPQFVRQVISARSQTLKHQYSLEIMQLVLTDSPHCQHFLTHRQEYSQALDKFVACVSRSYCWAELGNRQGPIVKCNNPAHCESSEVVAFRRARL